MSNKKTRKQKQIIGIVALVGLVGVGAKATIMMNKSDDEKDSVDNALGTAKVEGQMFKYTANGLVELVDLSTTETVDTVDLKTNIPEFTDEMNLFFVKDVQSNVLGAYNAELNSFYTFTVKDSKIVFETIYTNKELVDVKDFKIVEDTLYILTNKGANVVQVDLTDVDKKSTEFVLEGNADLFTVKGSLVYYTFDDNLGTIDLSTNEVKNILVGDTITDYALSTDKLYLLNPFGSGLNNSILIQLDLETLLVDDIKELGSKDNTILTEYVDDEIYIGQSKETLNEAGEVTKSTPQVVRYNAETLSTKTPLKDVPFDKDGTEVNQVIYEMVEDKAIIYSASSGKELTNIALNDSIGIMPLN